MSTDNRKIVVIFNSVLICLILILSFLLAKRIYFNEFYYKVPNIIGLNYEEVEKNFSSLPLNLRDMGETYSKLSYGSIALQEPKAGSVVKKNRNIKVWKSMGNPSIFLDNLVGMNYLDAVSIAEKNGIVIEKVKKMKSSIVPVNYVVATFPKSGEPMARGTKLFLLVSNGNF